MSRRRKEPEEVRLLREQLSQVDELYSQLTQSELVGHAYEKYSARVALARENVNVFCEHVLRDEATGARLRQQGGLHTEWHQLAEAHERLIIWAANEQGKCLGRGTLVMRADGHVIPVEEVSSGDELMGVGGSRRVLSTSRGVGPLYRIVPNKGESWVCNNVHVLTLVDVRTGAVSDVPLNEYLSQGGYWKNMRKLFRVLVDEFAGAGPLPVDPYFLGLWVGDGTKALRYSERREQDELRNVCVSKPDAEVELCVRAVAAAWGLRYTVQFGSSGCPTHRISSEGVGIRNPLLEALRDLLGPRLEIPFKVTRARREDRAAFLAGMIDSDGSANGPGCVELTQKRLDYAEAACFVGRSLGLLCTMRPKVVNGTTYWRCFLSGDFSEIPNRIARKIKLRLGTGKDSRRVGFRVEPVGEGEYFGFTLDGDGRFLLGDFTVTHNTSQLALGRILWKLGRSPNSRFAVVSRTHDQAAKLTRNLARYIEHSAELREVFPWLKPSKELPWTSTRIYVERETFSKDASIAAYGVGTQSILGSRLNGVILDDVLTDENTRTKDAREALVDWFRNYILTRLEKGAFVHIIGTAFHPEDLLHQMARQEPWVHKRYPVVKLDGSPVWPDRWPKERIDAKQIELGSIAFARNMMCVARDDSTAAFKREWLDRCLRRGLGRTMRRSLDLNKLPPGARVITGVDLAVERTESADLTVLFTIVFHSDGTREVIEVQSGRWQAPDIVARVTDAHKRFGSLCVVESNAAQKYIVHMLEAQSTYVPVKAFTTTGANKNHEAYGVSQLGAEFERGQWMIPCEMLDGAPKGHPEIEAWLDEVLYYDPKGHTGDRLMASWIACMGARIEEPSVETGRVNW